MDSIRNKFSSVVWDILVLKLVLHLLSIPKVVDKISDNWRIGADLLHGLDVKLEVRGVAAGVRMDISLLSDDDLVNEPGGVAGDRREPNPISTRQFPLKLF